MVMIRRLQDIFMNFDVLLTPISKAKNEEVLLANLAGLPALSIPVSNIKKGSRKAVQMIAKPFHEGRLIQSGHTYEMIRQGEAYERV